MVVVATWSAPGTAEASGGLDIATGATISEAYLDRLASNLLYLGGADGNTKTGAYTIGGLLTVSAPSANSGPAADLRGVHTDNAMPNLYLSRTTGTTQNQFLSFRGGVALDYLVGRKVNEDDLVFGTWGGSGAITERLRVTTVGTVQPGADNVAACGGASNRWTVVYAVNGTIQTSSRVEKEAVRPLAADAALQAVAGLSLHRFRYKGHSREHVGFMAEDAPDLLSPDHATVNAQTTASVCLAALKALLARVQALEAAPGGGPPAGPAGGRR